MDNEKELIELKETLSAVKAERDSMWKELADLRMAYNEEHSLNGRLLNIIENLSKQGNGGCK